MKFVSANDTVLYNGMDFRPYRGGPGFYAPTPFPEVPKGVRGWITRELRAARAGVED